MFLDSHAHLTCDPIFEDLEGVLERAQKQSVGKIVNVCTDEKTFKRSLDLIKKYRWIYQIGAVHPNDVEREGEFCFSIFERAAHKGLLAAVGETGLDYHYSYSSKKKQQEFLIRNFLLARECQLPVVIHCRNAFEDLFPLAAKEFLDGKVVLHCFSGSLEEARKGLDRGWLISFSGIITFKKSDNLRDVAKIVPLDQMMIETDSPYLAPQSRRGKTNEPSFIREIAQMIADIKGVPIEEIAEATQTNAKKFFRPMPQNRSDVT